MMAAQSFRAGVVMVVRRGDGAILACERADAPGSWQLPQGGIDRGESPSEAAWRELAEETALTADDVRLVSELPDWIVYEWPPELRTATRKFGESVLGQAQKWFLFGVIPHRDDSGDDAPGSSAAECAHHVSPCVDGREFRSWTWMDPHALVESVIDWRRDAYRRAFSRLLP